MSSERGRTGLRAVTTTDLAETGPAEGPGLEPASRSRQDLFAGLLVAARPRQWVKNVLVFAAPGAAGVLGHPGVAWRSFATFGLLCLVSSGGYLVNDALDSDADRRHPVKRYRPVAAGKVSVRAAGVSGAGAIVVGVVASALVRPELALVLAAYAVITVAYSIWLKHQPVLDLAAIATCFVLRAVAGGVATHLVLSNWFLIVASFGSLFVVVGKRSAEYADVGERATETRPILARYSKEFLSQLRWMSSAVTITAYCLWAFEKANEHTSGAGWFELSIAPFVLALLRYAFLLATGRGGAPEEVAFTDRQLQVMAGVWAAVVAIGVYAA
jgi:decaprenyl-phosphate phosphoribosyltransferase